MEATANLKIGEEVIVLADDPRVWKLGRVRNVTLADDGSIAFANVKLHGGGGLYSCKPEAIMPVSDLMREHAAVMSQINPLGIAVGDTVTADGWDGQSDIVKGLDFSPQPHGPFAEFSQGGFWRLSQLRKVPAQPADSTTKEKQ